MCKKTKLKMLSHFGQQVFNRNLPKQAMLTSQILTPWKTPQSMCCTVPISITQAITSRNKPNQIYSIALERDQGAILKDDQYLVLQMVQLVRTCFLQACLFVSIDKRAEITTTPYTGKIYDFDRQQGRVISSRAHKVQKNM